MLKKIDWVGLCLGLAIAAILLWPVFTAPENTSDNDYYAQVEAEVNACTDEIWEHMDEYYAAYGFDVNDMETY